MNNPRWPACKHRAIAADSHLQDLNPQQTWNCRVQAQLLATFSGQSSGGGPLAAAPKGFRPTGFPGRLPHASSLPRVVEETDVAVSLGAYAPPPPQPFATPPPLQRPQRTATPLTATATTPEAAAATGGVGQHAEKTIPQDFLPPPKLFQTPPQSLLPCTSGSPPISTAVSGGTLRGTLGKSQTADTSTLQVGLTLCRTSQQMTIRRRIQERFV